jgi:ubiquinone/menaquinone biosynthesis C-methylase UbiE
MSTQDLNAVNRAFSKQSTHFDQDDLQNTILQDLRKDVYVHVNKFLKPNSRILELNAGTGIDAKYFLDQGHTVHATDLSDGMIVQLNARKDLASPARSLTVQQVSFEDLHLVESEKFDLVFSNFGGLNCTNNLETVTTSLVDKVKTGGHTILVVMPRMCVWEIAGVLKGNTNAFRRFSRNGVTARLEGEQFTTWYHSLTTIRKAVPLEFEFVSSVGLAALSPPPHRDDLAKKRTGLYRSLRRLDSVVRHSFPFNRWADHLIVTFRKK